MEHQGTVSRASLTGFPDEADSGAPFGALRAHGSLFVDFEI